MSPTRDYIAILEHQYGGGSWCRDGDKQTAATRALKIFIADWKHLFSLKEGLTTVKVPVYDVTGHDNLRWDHRGVFDSDSQEEITDCEVIEVPVPTRRKRNARH